MIETENVDQAKSVEEKAGATNAQPEEDKFEESISVGLERYKSENIGNLDLKDKKRIDSMRMSSR